MILPNHYLLLSVVLFIFGLIIIAARRHILIRLLGLQLMFQAVNLALVALAEWFQVWEGQVAVLVVMTLSVVEFVLGVGFMWERRGLVHSEERVKQ